MNKTNSWDEPIESIDSFFGCVGRIISPASWRAASTNPARDCWSIELDWYDSQQGCRRRRVDSPVAA